ncbi:MAG: glycoside hydrolase family 3 C-terminal domain-containing protein [Tannerellaceae bacterium]|nr:glycoside hydrolase family 3 C-terminal domain-containing protein [Tannerellaceae bacterium]
MHIRTLSRLIVVFFLISCNEKYDYPFQNPNLPVEQRVEDLLSRMTLEEKVVQMTNVTPAIERLGIPPYDWWNEALHGVARAGKATVFPQSIGLAATFDTDDVHETFSMISDEARAKYYRYQQEHEYDRYKGLTFWTPNINIFRDPRWGRGMETYGEDPFLTARMGVAVVKGLQEGDGPDYFKTHACAKHYAVHSGPEWNRHEFDVSVSQRDMWETYLPAFEVLVKEGNVQEVMCGYNRLNGEPCCANAHLLIDILRNTWDYQGLVVSDCGAIDDFWVRDPRTPRHETHPDKVTASVDALSKGTDLDCGSNYGSLLTAVREGLLSEEQVDISLRRLLKGRFELGMFDPLEQVSYNKIPYSVVESPEHVQKAIDMARKSIVLMKNKNNTLPLSKEIKKIAVVGPNAADSTMLWANYNGYPTHTVTILEGIRNKVPGAEIVYEQGCGHVYDFVINDLVDHVLSPLGQGFEAEFFNNPDFEGTPVYAGNVKEIHYTTGGNTQFAPNVNLTNFSARFKGVFEAPLQGAIEFELSGNDGFRLFIDGEKVAEMWESEYTNERRYTLQAEKGKKYDLVIEYMQRTGSADLNFLVGVKEPVDFKGTANKVKDADVIIYVGGISSRLEGEELPMFAEGFKKGDRTSIEIPKVQREMVKALKATGKPVVYVLCTGSAIGLEWEEQNLDAILNAWYGGQEAGTAVADVLFGDYNPAGRLPVTFYRSDAQLPDYEDYTMKGRTYRYMTEKPLYPFGYGLSYTTFNYGDAQLSKTTIRPDEPVTLKVNVQNTGSLAGDEVVQVYVKELHRPEAPVKSLKGFKRIHIPAGETATTEIILAANAFESYNESTQTMVVKPGKYQILYGGSSDDNALKALDIIIE